MIISPFPIFYGSYGYHLLSVIILTKQIKKIKLQSPSFVTNVTNPANCNFISIQYQYFLYQQPGNALRSALYEPGLLKHSRKPRRHGFHQAGRHLSRGLLHAAQDPFHSHIDGFAGGQLTCWHSLNSSAMASSLSVCRRWICPPLH